MYLRFIVTQIDPDSTRRQGVFAAAYGLLDSLEITPDDRIELRRILDWFRVNLPIPKRLTTRGAIFWFKSDATETIRQIWQLVHLLRRNDHQVELIKSRKAGYIFYEDHLQVGAIPFTDTLS